MANAAGTLLLAPTQLGFQHMHGSTSAPNQNSEEQHHHASGARRFLEEKALSTCRAHGTKLSVKMDAYASSSATPGQGISESGARERARMHMD